MVTVTAPMLKEKALKFAGDLGREEEFKASNGWLNAFVKRNNIVFRTQQGEGRDVNQSTVDEWKIKLVELCKGYAPKDIYNMDETGLFFRGSNKKTFHFKGEDCKGGKLSKERLTVGLCASLSGEKEMPIVIGKSTRPRCFSNITISSLPVHYYANKKAWMTSSIMEDWLKYFDQK